MTRTEIHAVVEKQRAYFNSGKTLPVEQRIEALCRLRLMIRDREQEINEAIRKDLGKSAFESYMCEVGMALSELSYMIARTKAFAKPRTVLTPLAQFAAKSYVQPSPYGVCLVMSPWNYPFMLAIDPLADAIAAGNTVILKPSAYSPHTSAVLEKLIADCFDPAYVTVITGGREENQSLLDEKFDYIFFTGGQAVGKEVMEKAAKHLTPVTLELGGKSPCIVDETAKIPLAAKRIVFGKFLNCGQTCVAPDYVICHESIRDRLVDAIKTEITRQYGEDPLNNSDYGKIINRKHFDRLMGLLDGDEILHGGQSHPAEERIAPTLLAANWDSAAMQQEIFGPILPILTYQNLDDIVRILQDRQKPLAFYLFSENRETVRKLSKQCQFGGGCINDTIIHLATSEMGFGGVGESGMGAYHGKVGFDTFSHHKSIVKKATWMDLPMRYQPYRSIYEKLLRMFLR